eukprot:scaffold3900_cov258-Pinguiococcus_pyrenoidosus.AAC.4
MPRQSAIGRSGLAAGVMRTLFAACLCARPHYPLRLNEMTRSAARLICLDGSSSGLIMRRGRTIWSRRIFIHHPCDLNADEDLQPPIPAPPRPQFQELLK